jgi:hypothetical protein
MTFDPSHLRGAPPHGTCLRHAPAHYREINRALWAQWNGLSFPVVVSQDRAFLSRLCDPTMRPIEEALGRLLDERLDLAEEAQIPPKIYHGTFALEGACAQMERAASDLLGSFVDGMLVSRAHAYVMNGQIEQTVMSLTSDPATPWWIGQGYHVQWTEVALLEHWNSDKAASAADAEAAAEATLDEQIDHLALSQQDLEDLRLLAQAARGELNVPASRRST